MGIIIYLLDNIFLFQIKEKTFFEHFFPVNENKDEFTKNLSEHKIIVINDKKKIYNFVLKYVLYLEKKNIYENEKKYIEKCDYRELCFIRKKEIVNVEKMEWE